MSVVLILLAYFFIFAIFYFKSEPKTDLRLLSLFSTAVLGLLITLITESLSLILHFEKTWLLLTWLLVDILLFVLLIRNWRKPVLGFSFKDYKLLDWFNLLGAAGICLLSLVIALKAAPNNWDSMVYHMSRVAHWIQNRSINFYPTAITRQLYLSPFAEYTIANLQILSGGDHLANLPQWFSMLGSLLGVSYITKKLGGSRLAQTFAVAIAASLPMSILQSTTTQNDYVLTFWLVSLCVFILEYWQNPGRLALLGTAFSLALAGITKSTAYIYAFPFILYFGIQGLKKFGFSFWKQTLLVSFILLVVNLPHFMRNYNTFGSPLGASEEVSRYHNAEYTPAVLASNLIRNVGLYLGSVEAVNQPLNQLIQGAHSFLGLEINDARTTWEDHQFQVAMPQVNEDLMSSNLHFMLFFLALVILFIKRKELPQRSALTYALLLLAGFVLFCGYLRWQQWHPRLHLPLFVLGAAFSALLADRFNAKLVWLVSFGLFLFTLPVFYMNPSKPVLKDWSIFNLPRREVMILRKNLVVPYIDGVYYLAEEKGCYEIGLHIPDEEWEYPFWSLFAEFEEPYRIEHVNINNVSADLEMDAFSPCAIISTQPPGEVFTLDDGSQYFLDWELDPIGIYIKK